MLKKYINFFHNYFLFLSRILTCYFLLSQKTLEPSVELSWKLCRLEERWFTWLRINNKGSIPLIWIINRGVVRVRKIGRSHVYVNDDVRRSILYLVNRYSIDSSKHLREVAPQSIILNGYKQKKSCHLTAAAAGCKKFVALTVEGTICFLLISYGL